MNEKNIMKSILSDLQKTSTQQHIPRLSMRRKEDFQRNLHQIAGFPQICTKVLA